jgi:hypothetical protein
MLKVTLKKELGKSVNQSAARSEDLSAYNILWSDID